MGGLRGTDNLFSPLASRSVEGHLNTHFWVSGLFAGPREVSAPTFILTDFISLLLTVAQPKMPFLSFHPYLVLLNHSLSSIPLLP